jgi:hypothetical protein
MAHKIKRRGLTVFEQAADMRLSQPEFVQRLSQTGMSWTGPLTPTPLSVTYTIEIVYRRHWPPQVWVKHPMLAVKKEDFRVVHIYSEGCLCLNAEEEWRPWMTISSTFVPWAAEWLFYFEAWIATGAWHGGGEYRVSPRRIA